MFKKKTRKWFEVNGDLLGENFAKAVSHVSAVKESTMFKEGFSSKEFYFTVNHVPYNFTTESEAKAIREDMITWIKEVQG